MIIIELLSSTLKEFAEITNDSGTTSNEATVNATVKEFDGQTYVQIDGSDQFTPIETTVNLSDGERVMVLLKNHTATVTGNSTSPAVRTSDLSDLLTVVDDRIVGQMKGFEINFTEDLNDVTDIANNANTAAGNALTAANDANTAAGNALTAANNASSDAADALTAANEASSEAADASTAASNAGKIATNFISGNSSGIVVGWRGSGTVAENVQIASDGINIRDGSTVLASFTDDAIQLGCNSTESVISLCGGRGTIQADGTIVGGSGLEIVSDEGIAIGSTSDDSVKVQLSPAGVTSFTSNLWLEGNSVSIKGTDSEEFNGDVSIDAYDIQIGQANTYATDAVRVTADRISLNTPLDDTSAGIYLNGGYVRLGEGSSTIRIGTSTSTIYIGGALYPPSSSGSGDPLDAYPVGAVYISYKSTSPASLFGGTWTSITGVFPYFNAGTSTGGSNTHTLTVSQIPSHRHYMLLNASAAFASGTTKSGYLGVGTGGKVSDYEGGDASHNNMPSYQTFYAWRRTA